MFTLVLSRSVVIPKLYEYLTSMTANFLLMRNITDIYRNKDNTVVIFYRTKNGSIDLLELDIKWKDVYGMEKV